METLFVQLSIDMVLVSQQPQLQNRDGESQPLIQKVPQATSQAAPRQSLVKRVLKVGGVLIAIDLLVCTLFVFFNPHWFRFGRYPSAKVNEIYGLPHAVGTSFTAITRHI